MLDELIGSSAGFTCRCLLVATDAAAPKVLFKLNTTEDAPTILRFVTNYLAVEPTAQVAAVGYAGGINFILKDALDANGKPYDDQLAALTAPGVRIARECSLTHRRGHHLSAGSSMSRWP